MATSPGMTDDESVDLVHYLQLVADHWLWLAIPAILAVLGSVVAGLVLPPTYEAVALVRVDPSPEAPDSDALILFAMSDGVLEDAFDQMPSGIAAKFAGAPDLRSVIRAHYTKPFVVLTVQANDPVSAATLANQWAEAIRDGVNGELRSPPTSSTTLAKEADSAMEVWRAAEMAWIESERSSRQVQIEAESQAASRRLADLAVQQGRLEVLIDRAQTLEEELSTAGRSQQASGEAAFATSVITREFSQIGISQAMIEELASGDLLDDGATATGAGPRITNADLIDAVDSLLAAAAIRKDLLLTEGTRLQTDLEAFSAELSEGEMDAAELKLNRDQAREYVIVIGRRQGEQTLTTEERADLANIPSMASPPSEPQSPRPLRDGILAGIGGVLLGLAVLLMRDWWSARSQPGSLSP